MKTQTKQLIWSRSREDWLKDQEILKESPYKVLHLPCIEKKSIRPDEKILKNLEKVKEACFFVFTSQEAVMKAWDIMILQELMRKNPCLCFGEKTKKLLHKKKLKTVFFAHCDSAEMMLLPLLNFLPAYSQVLLPGPKERAFPLHDKLLEKGFKSTKIDLYKTISEAKDKLGRKLNTKISSQIAESSFIFFASPSAVKGFVKTCILQLKIPCNHLEALCIGPSSMKEAKLYFKKVKQTRPY